MPYGTGDVALAWASPEEARAEASFLPVAFVPFVVKLFRNSNLKLETISLPLSDPSAA
jgi:hypothetical protein